MEAFGGQYLPYASQVAAPAEAPARSVLPSFDCLMAAENHPAARNVYGFRPPPTGSRALLVGNEAKGLRRPTLKQAHALLEIPLLSKNINCLNAAAAAAVMLYYLHWPEPLPLPRRTLTAVQKQRPDLLLCSGPDPMELGSGIRSACAFGWDRVFLQDRGNAWYACNRKIKSEGRGAARRGRNPIKVLPYQSGLEAAYRHIVVCTRALQGKPLPFLSLTGSDTLLLLADEHETAVPWLPASSSSTEIVYTSLPSVTPDRYHFRQPASIALAEAARQLGWPDSAKIYLHSRTQRYRRSIEAAEVETLHLEELCCL